MMPLFMLLRPSDFPFQNGSYEKVIDSGMRNDYINMSVKWSIRF